MTTARDFARGVNPNFDMEARINIDLVRFAVGRAIDCPTCTKILDVDSAVLLSKGDKVSVICRSCWQDLRAGISTEIEVIYGRTGTATTWTGASAVEPVPSKARIDGDQGDLFDV